MAFQSGSGQLFNRPSITGLSPYGNEWLMRLLVVSEYDILLLPIRIVTYKRHESLLSHEMIRPTLPGWKMEQIQLATGGFYALRE